ncbi:MAG TPA: OmpA family protein [Pirellulales bacterium]|jgi:chemotaxis protein MotB|nr:OmpA family protein [Pirellulales bacterium]
MSVSACRLASAALLALLGWSAGCQLAPKQRLTASELQNRNLVEQNKALVAENENLKTHDRTLEDQLKQAEEELAALDERVGIDRRRMSNYEREREEVQKQLGGLVRGRGVPVSVGNRLVQLAKEHPALEIDRQTGAAKLDVDVLFDSGEAKLRTEAHGLLDEFAELLQSPEARELRVMVVGHTDSRRIIKRETKQRYPDNWHLSTARALAVAEYLQSKGVDENQVGVASFGRHQPIASNQTADERQRNRRVELFITGPETPVVGWHDTKVRR